MGVVVRFWALERRIMLWEVWLDEGDPVCRINTGEEGGAKSLKNNRHTNSNPDTGKLLLLLRLGANLRLHQPSLGSKRWRVHSPLD